MSKRLKKIILSILLSAFTFVVIHDYALDIVDTHLQHELSPMQKSDITDSDLPEKIHAYIHFALDALTFASKEISSNKAGEKPLEIESTFISRIYTIDPKPPLA